MVSGEIVWQLLAAIVVLAIYGGIAKARARRSTCARLMAEGHDLNHDIAPRGCGHHIFLDPTRQEMLIVSASGKVAAKYDFSKFIGYRLATEDDVFT